MRSLPTLILAVAAVLLLGTAFHNPAGLYEVRDGSRFAIDGTATTGPFSCEVDRVNGSARLAKANIDGSVTVPVRAFECGLSRMNRDFYQALRGEAHPAIRFELDEARVLQAPAGSGEWVPVVATGTLHLAGQARRIAIRGQGVQLADGRVRIRGTHPLQMSDYGIEPPSALMGLVRVSDRVVARFDLTASPR